MVTRAAGSDPHADTVFTVTDCVGFADCPCGRCAADRRRASGAHPFHADTDPNYCESCTRAAREAAAELGRPVRPGTCLADSGAATGCRPVCDRPAVRVLTYGGYGGPYVTRLCDTHADGLAARVYPDQVASDTRDERHAHV